MTSTSTSAPSLEAKQLQRLMEISLILNSTTDIEELLQYVLKVAVEVLDSEAASIILFDEKRQHLFIAASTGLDTKTAGRIPIPLEGSIAGSIFRDGKRVINNNVAQDSQHFAGVGLQTNFVTRSLVGVPMKIKDRSVGVLEALNKHSGDFTLADAQLLNAIASHAAVAIHNARLLQALQKANEELTKTDQLKNNLLALASHELRTPLGIIIGYASFLQEEGEGEFSEHAQKVLDAANQLKSLIESITSLHLLEAKGLTFNPRTVSAQQVITDAYNEALKASAGSKPNLSFDLPKPPLLITADPDKLAPALANIIDNAIRFSPNGGTIVVSAKQDRGNVLITIRDNGLGLASDQLTKIFHEFYQVEDHKTRRFGGLGIGLTISKGLIESQGGRIWAESEGLGKGSSFNILLPPAGTTALTT
jgi:K+-sensing histidine kinase KdpD